MFLISSTLTRRPLRCLLLASAAVMIAGTAQAQMLISMPGTGGAGGGSGSGGEGGSPSWFDQGTAGGDGPAGPGGSPYQGAGGGGAGSTGGNGGSVANSPAVLGGAGGVAGVTYGEDGGDGGFSGAGGGGGAHGFGGNASSFVSDTYYGGDGGQGGNGDSYGGGGGGGGYGAILNMDGETLSLDSQFYGGAGGAGGSGASAPGGGGTGGGGLGIQALSGGTIVLTDNVTAIGGQGGEVDGGERAGDGGAGLIVRTGTGSTTLTSAATLQGGSGGYGYNNTAGGMGGAGLVLVASPSGGTLTANINGEVSGGYGGVGYGAAPNGGDGGYGIVAGDPASPNNSGVTIINVNAYVVGGAGAGADGAGGSAGDGGAAILGFNSTITVAEGVFVEGGAGGRGNGDDVPATDGTGGYAITGNTVAIILEGGADVWGGLGGDQTRSAAIHFGSGTNSLELRGNAAGALATINGGITHYANSDTLILGGTNDVTIGATELWGVADGFGSLAKTGTSTWTLTGDFSASTLPWTLREGTISISDDKSLGDASAAVAMEGGTLAVTETFTTSRSFTLGNDAGELGGTFFIAADKTLTIESSLYGSGTLTKEGAGTLVLDANNRNYTGAVTVSAGTLALARADALGGATSVTLGTATLDISETRGAVINNLASSEADSRVVLGAQTLTVNVPGATSFAGVIQGTGVVVVTGGGEFTLSGDNTYTGTTEVNGAYLYIGAGGTTGSVAGDITVDGLSMLVFNRSNSTTIANNITASAGTVVVFSGGGTFTYAGATAIDSYVSVQEGATLHLAGDQFAVANTLTVDNGSVLSGNGTVNIVAINAGGTLAPGNSPGQINVSSLSFTVDSTYRVDATPSGEHDLVVASGIVDIDAGAKVELVAAPGKYEADSRYAIITATGGVTGAFGSVSENYAFLDAALEYDATNVYLLLTSNSVDFASYARTPNQFSTAVAAQALGGGNAIYDALLMLPENAVPAAFDALSGEAYVSVNTVIQQQSIYVRNAVSGRLREALTAPGVSPLAYGPGPAKAPLAEGYTPTLWAQGYGGWGETSSNGNATSISNTIGGFLIGADVSVAETARAGLFAGYSRSTFEVDGRSSSGSMNNYDLGLYAGAQFGAMALRGGASYTWHDLTLSRSVVFPGFAESLEGSDTIGTAQVFGEIGYDMEVGAVALEPFLGLAYVNVSGASLGEEGGAAALSVSTDDMSTLYSTLGVRLATTVEVGGRMLTPYATLGWQHAFGDVTPTASMQFIGGATPFSISGVPVAEDALLLEAGLSYALSPTAQIGATYAGQLSGDASQNAFTAQFSLRF